MPVAKGSTIDPARTRAAVIDAAAPLLYDRGIDGVGVAELCKRLGISKETLYRHFGTKDGLVHAVLEARSDRVIAWLTAAAAAAGGDPADRLAAVFGALGEWYLEPDFRGCAMINAATQHYEPEVRAITARHLDRCLALFTDIAARAGSAAPDDLGRRLLFLMEGATAVAAHRGPDHVREQACTAALSLLNAAAPGYHD
ncbi:TetR/AcrR family transcriptional regulator [Nocardia rhamnosiphila]|uniref:TetR/AcrR family transcriptional regulator n=1 Tax=Nocardia rhamnosiphila TaxID=426716 RepID=UPI0004C32D1F|nr:TetR/AcrR family transcriptional regulator [Nocardia rhamnosiphila]